jgi:hypothetical protein
MDLCKSTGAHPASYVVGSRGSFPGGKAAGAWSWPLTSSAEVKECVELAIRGCIQKFLDWPPGARTANGTALCHKVQFYHYFVSRSSEFCHHNPLCCFSTSVCCCLFRCLLSPETFGYTLVPPLPQYAFIAWCPVTKNSTGITLPKPFFTFKVRPDYDGMQRAMNVVLSMYFLLHETLQVFAAFYIQALVIWVVT